jgi:hypothetical protein
VFYWTLRRALQPDQSLSLKTRLADVLHCPPDLWDAPHGRRLAQKHVDFVIYDWQTTAIVAVVELDDRSHARAERRQRDAFLSHALAEAEIALVRVKAAPRYDATVLQQQILNAIAQKVIGA